MLGYGVPGGQAEPVQTRVIRGWPSVWNPASLLQEKGG